MTKILQAPADTKCSNELFQAARIVDVFVLGPIMIRAGNKIGGAAGTFLTLSGILTIVFNGATFLDIQRDK